MLKAFIFSLIFFIFISCNKGSQHEPREVKTLYFKGSVTNGIDYYCGERQGVTKGYTQDDITKYGAITCVYSPITFKLGSLYLGKVSSIKDQQNIYPQTLIPSFDGDFNNKSLLKIAILLQSLDDKKHTEYINISQKTKDKITLKSLDGISIENLYTEIRKMGFTPIDAVEAKLHLILNSENTNIGKPKIKPFEEDISSSLMVGNSIGQLSIDAGDGTLHYPFILEGEGEDFFLLNNQGKLILTKMIDDIKDFNLTVTASNEYGYSTQTVKIHVQNSGKIGKVQMGRLKNATVKLFKLNPLGTKDLIGSTTTKSIGSLNQIGNFDLMSEELDDHDFYIYEVTEGIDIDSNDDGIKDEITTKNLGKLRLLTKGIWIKNAMHKIRITPLSEILYTYVENLPYSELEEQLHHHATLLLKESLNRDYKVDAKDITLFNPLYHKKLLTSTLTYNNTYQNIVNKIRAGDQSYKKDIFTAYIVDSYQSNAIEIVGSTVYTIDMMKSGEFRIYDLETKKLIGKLKLPNTPVEEDSHVIYVNLLDNEVRISSLRSWAYNVNIKNQNKLLLVDNPFIIYASISGNFSRLAIGDSLLGNLFSKEKKTYFYNFDLNLNDETRKIKVIKSTLENSEYLYTLNSELSRIDSLWSYKDYLYIIGDNKINIFQEKDKKMEFLTTYNLLKIVGNILGIEEDILYILEKNRLTLMDITKPLKPKFIETVAVPFVYKLGIKTNGKYITTGSKIIDIKTLRASKNAK